MKYLSILIILLLIPLAIAQDYGFNKPGNPQIVAEQQTAIQNINATYNNITNNYINITANFTNVAYLNNTQSFTGENNLSAVNIVAGQALSFISGFGFNTGYIFAANGAIRVISQAYLTIDAGLSGLGGIIALNVLQNDSDILFGSKLGTGLYYNGTTGLFAINGSNPATSLEINGKAICLNDSTNCRSSGEISNSSLNLIYLNTSGTNANRNISLSNYSFFANTIGGSFNWTLTVSRYFIGSFNGARLTLDVNEEMLNATISNMGVRSNWNSTYNITYAERNTTNVFNRNNSFRGIVDVTHLDGNSGVPVIVAGAGLGTGPTVSISGTDLAGEINVTSGTLPALGANVFTVTFNQIYTSKPYVVFSPADPNSALLSGAQMVYVTSNLTSFTFTAGASALGGSTNYIWNYVAVQ